MSGEIAGREEEIKKARQELDQAALAIVDQVTAMAITTPELKENAVALGQVIVTAMDKRVQFHAPMRSATHKAHKAVCDSEKESLVGLTQARDDLAEKIEAWNEEQDRLAEVARQKEVEAEREREKERKRIEDEKEKERLRLVKEAEDIEAEKQRKLDEAAKAKAEEARKLKEAEDAKAAGDKAAALKLEEEAAGEKQLAAELTEQAAADQKTADTLADEVTQAEVEDSAPAPAPVPIPLAVGGAKKTKGGSRKTNYSAHVYDEMELIKAVAAGTAPRRCVIADKSYLDSRAKIDKEDINDIPGVELNTDKKQTFRKLTK